MKAFLKENRILLVIILLTFVVAVVVLGGRLNQELKNKTYDIVLDYNEMEKMAEQSDHDLIWWFEKFKTLGITKVAIPEETTVTLRDNPNMSVSGDAMDVIMRESSDWKKDYPAPFITAIEDFEFDKCDYLIECGDTYSFDFVSEAVVKRFHADQYLIYKNEDGSGYILMDGNEKNALYSSMYKVFDSTNTGFMEIREIIGSKAMYLNLGLLSEKVETARAAGMDIVPRSGSYEGWNDTKFAKAVTDDYDALGVIPEYMIFTASSVLGFDDGIEYFTEYSEENDITIGLIENTTQLQNILQYGLDELVLTRNYDTNRVFTVWDYIQYRYQYYGYPGPEEIENTLFRAVVERNVRIIYFKPFKEYKDYNSYITDFSEYEVMFTNFFDRAAKHNFTMGDVDGIGTYAVSQYMKMILGLGVAAAGVFLLATIIPMSRRWKLGIAAVAAIGILGMFVVRGGIAELVTSFGAAVIFPCLALVYLMRQSKEYQDNLDQETGTGKVILRSAFILIITVAICLAGGLFAAAPLASSNYLIEISIFRGVKLAQLLPIIFMPIAYLAYFGWGKTKRIPGKIEMNDIKDMMNGNIKIWMAVIAMALLGVGVYYIMRTGHDTEIMPSTFEMLLRNTLEQWLIARPRTKEFMFAFPAIMLLVYTSVRKIKILPVVFGLCSVIGLTSVVNTFLHFRTPLYLGFARTGYSVLFGIILGAVAILILEGFYRLYKKYRKADSLNA